jgi:hypothetical protein
VTDLSLLLPSIGEWTSLQAAGGWASVIALVLTLYTAVRIRKVRQYIERDRELQDIASLAEIHDYLQQVREYIRVCPTEPEQLHQRYDALEKITISSKAIVSYYRAAFQVNLPSGRALLYAAKDHKRNRRIGQAILSFEMALDNHDKYGGLTRADLSECLCDLQICYLIAWRGEDAARVGRLAEREGLTDCIPENRVKKICVPLYVTYTARLFAGDVICTLARRKPKMNTLRWI